MAAMKVRDLDGMPNLKDLLDEARERGCQVEMVHRTGEVRISDPRVRGPRGTVTCNVRKKSGNRALLVLVRKAGRS